MSTSIPTEAQRDKLDTAFEVMDGEARRLLVEIAIQYASNWPAVRPKPLLRVVSSSDRAVCNHGLTGRAN